MPEISVSASFSGHDVRGKGIEGFLVDFDGIHAGV